MSRKWLSLSLRAAVLLLTMLSVAMPTTAAASSFNSKIAFVLGPDIYSMNPDGSDVKQLTAVSPNLTFGPAWSPDGQSIIYSLYPPDVSSGAVYEMNADGSNQRQIFSDPSGLVPNSASFSKDGKNIVMDLCNNTAGGCALYRIRADGTQLIALTHFGPNPDVADVWPAYAPDGKTIAFTSFSRGGLKFAVYLMDADGKNVRLLTPPELQAAQPRWSPDGSKLVFQAHYCEGGGDIHGFNEEIWTIGADGTGATQVTNNNQGLPVYTQTPHDWFPAWSPAGDQIVFERDNGTQTVFSVYVVNADGSGERAVSAPSPMNGRRATVGGKPVRGRAVGAPNVHRIEKGGGDPSWSPEL